MKRFSLIITLVISIMFGFNVYASSNDIKKISMNIYVDELGDAYVTEVWNASLNKGTEGYKTYGNLGNSVISDYKVTLNDKEYTTLTSWNVSASFDDKAYKAGINKIDNGVELCFGISKYGNNTYTLKYKISNFVSTTDDSDIIYWTLVPSELSDKPEYTYIKIYSDFKYDKDTPVYGYGNYGGYAYVYDGFIELVHEDPLDSDEYMTVLAKFPKGTFKTTSDIGNNFDYYLNLAEDGATSYVEEKLSFWEILGVIINFIVPFVIIVAIFASIASGDFGTKKVKISKEVKNFPKKDYFRDLPLNKDIFKAYWVSGFFKLFKNKTDFLGAVLLKWLKNGNIENVTVQSKILKKETRAVKLLNKTGMNEKEVELFDMMFSASGDGVLESNEFTKWCKNHYNKILKWFNNVVDDTTEEMVLNGYLTKEKKTFSTLYNSNLSLMEPAKQMTGLKNFLNDFSSIKDKESIEVKIWDEYLMFAQIFGIAKKVAKEFKNLYPDVIPEDYYDDIIFINNISYQGVHAASQAKSRAESYSAGGGGFSSGGGGGGSFGGGSSGGGFR